MKKVFPPFVTTKMIVATIIGLTTSYSATVAGHAQAFANTTQVLAPTDQRTSRENVSEEAADIRKLVEISKKRARSGNLEAQKFLFEIYRKGLKSVSKDQAEALKWVRMSAAQGDVNSQADLGTMFATGAGGERDLKAARQWFLRAASRGNEEAQSNLGVIYQFGKGVPVNLEEAAKWFRLAVKQGNSIAKEQLDKVQKSLFLSMSSERQACFKNLKCKDAGPLYLVDADGDWFLRVEKNLNRLSLLILKDREKPHFSRVIEDRLAPKIFLGIDQKFSLEAFKNYIGVSGAEVQLNESPRHYRMQIVSSEIVNKLVKSLENGQRPILALKSENYWAGAEFFHLSKTIIDYEMRTGGRSLQRDPAFLCVIMSSKNFSDFPSLNAMTDCGGAATGYDESLVKLERGIDPDSAFSRVPGKWSVENMGDRIYASVNGELIDGDRLRMAFNKSCDEVHTFTSFHTMKTPPKMLEVEDRIASGIFDGEKINVKILFILEVRHMRSALVSLGWNAVEDIKRYFESKDDVSLSMLDDDQFKATDYLDLG